MAFRGVETDEYNNTLLILNWKGNLAFWPHFDKYGDNNMRWTPLVNSLSGLSPGFFIQSSFSHLSSILRTVASVNRVFTYVQL